LEFDAYGIWKKSRKIARENFLEMPRLKEYKMHGGLRSGWK